MGEKDGAFRATIEGVVAHTDRSAGGGAAQVELFDDVGGADEQPPAGWDAPSSLAGPPAKRGGRPKGALNKRSLDLARFFQAKYRDPAAVLGELISRDPVELWREICVLDPGEDAPSLMDVIRLQAAVARDLLPYLHAKRPVEIKTDKTPVFVMPAFGESVEQAVAGVFRLDEGIEDVDE